jgi:HSP20 family protein
MARLVRFEPFREIPALHNEVSRLMNGLLQEGSGNAQSGHSWVPAADVWETEHELVYAFDLPGIPEETISIEVENGLLSVSAERERPAEVAEERFYRFERRFGSFARAITLPPGIPEDAIKAQLENGVLELRVAKPAAPKPKKIQIGSSEQATIEA